MSVSKYISIQFSSVLCWGVLSGGVADLRGSGSERSCVSSGPSPASSGEGGLFHACSVTMLSPGVPLRPVQSHPQSMCRYLPGPGFPAPTFYSACQSGQEVHTEGPSYVMSFNHPINYRLTMPHLCHLL